MIYINNGASTTIKTESWLSTIPSTVYVKFDDIVIGEFINVSTIPTYLIFEISKETISSLKLENMEYQMKLYFNYSLFKIELITVVSNRLSNLVEKETTITVKMKEL